MSEEKNQTLTYNGNEISVVSDEKTDFVNLTDLAKVWKGRKSISSWLKNKQTLDYLNVWEKKNNPQYRDHQMGVALKMAREGTLSIKNWIEVTNAKGIITRTGLFQGTYAHKDIAIKFAGWLNPDLELWIVEKIQELRELEEQKNSFQLLTHEEVLSLVKLKEIFKYVAHQAVVEDAHRDVYSAQSGAKNTIAQFHKFRNDILDIAPSTIDDRIKQYCLKHSIPLSKKIANKTKREKILMLDSYDAVKFAVWDFLSINGEVNALSLADLVSNMMRIEKGEVIRKNEADLFREKEDLGEYDNLEKVLSEHPKVKTAREVLYYRELSKGQLQMGNKTQIGSGNQFGRLLGAVARAGKPDKE